jgi:hypothetical protein
VAEISAASREQSTGIEQVNKAVMQMDETTQQNAALVEQAAAASQAIVEQAQSLNEIISRYQVGEEPAAASASPVERRAPSRPWTAGATPPAAKPVRTAAGAAAASKAAAPRKAANAGADTEWKEF